MQNISPSTIKSFFEWVLSQRRGKDGRRLGGVRSEDSLRTYYKHFRQVCETVTGVELGGVHNNKAFKRKVWRVSNSPFHRPYHPN